jgi:hypothetical protein
MKNNNCINTKEWVNQTKDSLTLIYTNMNKIFKDKKRKGSYENINNENSRANI